MAHAVGSLVAVAPGQGEIALGQVSGGGNLVGASALALLLGQIIVGKLKVVDDFAEELFVGVLCVGGLLRGLVLIDLLVNPWHLTEHGDELEVEVGAQEADLSFALCRCLPPKHVVAVLLQGDQGAVAA